MRILIRTSKLAIWSRRLGGFALPLAIIAVFLHRAKSIDTEIFVIVMGIATLLGLFAFLTALGAFVRLWSSGDKGWSRAGAGFILGAILLAPAGMLFYQGLIYPRTIDVWTDENNPPELVIAGGLLSEPALDYGAVAEEFPNLVNRAYAAEPTEVFAIIESLMSDLGWDVRVRRIPDTLGRPGQLNVTTTTLFGFEDEVSMRVEATQAGTVVAMRSASLYGGHDAGTNGRRVEKFLLALDIAVSEFIRDRPTDS